MSAVPGPTTDILATLVWDTWDSATYHWPSHWEGEKLKCKMQVYMLYISCRGINWELGFRFSDQVKLLGCDQVARCAKHVCKIAKLVCVRCFVWNPRGSDIYMMGEGLRCRLIRSKPSELGQKVGNKSDKARGGDGAARAWRATAALSSPSSPAGASLDCCWMCDSQNWLVHDSEIWWTNAETIYLK